MGGIVNRFAGPITLSSSSAKRSGSKRSAKGSRTRHNSSVRSENAATGAEECLALLAYLSADEHEGAYHERQRDEPAGQLAGAA